MKSRSERAVISRLAILPKASSATRAPGIVPWRLANSSRTAANRRRSSVSASAVNCSPARSRVTVPGQQAGSDQELLLLPDDAGAVDHLLVVARVAKKRLDLGRRSTLRRAHVVGKGRIDQPVHDMGAVDHRLGHARRRGHQRHQQAAQVGVVAQQREQLHARRQARQEIVEPGQRLVGIAGFGNRRQQRRQQFGQMRARRRGAGRGVAAIVPLADRRRWPWTAP